MLVVLPERTDSGAANMATDLLLLKRYPRPAEARLRTYGWSRPTITFGYAQRIQEVETQLRLRHGAEAPRDLIRRPSGGGIVDHRDDWTYALVVPRGRRLSELPAFASYTAVHEALARALSRSGQACVLHQAPAKGAEKTAQGGCDVCFDRPVVSDIVRADDGRKIAGSAQKRTREGLLFQGSVSRRTATEVRNWDALPGLFAEELGRELDMRVAEAAWPAFADEEMEALIEQFGSEEWRTQR